MRKKFLCMCILISVFLFVLGQAVSAEAANTGKTRIKAEFNKVTVTLNNKVLGTETIKYDGKIFVPLNDACSYFGCDFKTDNPKKIINIIDGKAAVGKKGSGTKGTQTVEVILNPYKIQFKGLDTYLNSFSYKGLTYIPVSYFAEIFNKKTTWQSAANKVVISDLPVKVIGTVDGDKLTEKELNFTLYPSAYEVQNGKMVLKSDYSKEALSSLKSQIFDSMVMNKIISHKAEQNKVVLDAEDLAQINTTIASVVNDYGGISKFRELLGGYDTSFNQVVSVYRERYIAYKFERQLASEIKTSDEELQKYYDDHKSEYVQPEEVRAKHILISTRDKSGQPLSADQKELSKKKAEDILTKIKVGYDFDQLMKENSEDPGLAQSPDGYTFPRGEMVKEFEDAAFAMSVGQVSDLVETPYGYHIIKLEEKIPEKQMTFDEVKEDIKAKASDEKYQQHITSLLDKWKSESKIVNMMK